MNSSEKEVIKSQLEAERQTLFRLKAIYEQAARDVSEKLEISDGKIEILLKDIDNADEQTRSILQSQIYQRNFQKNLKSQLDFLLEDLNDRQFNTISEYLEGTYENSFIGTLYNLNTSGIPVVIPINPEMVIRAMSIDSKLSKSLYESLGEDVGRLKKRIANNISRGISTASPYSDIARNIASNSKVGRNRAMCIARTESGRIYNVANLDSAKAAKDKTGADLVKVWDSTLDKRTRPHHQELDGQVRELDEDFEVKGLKASAPGHFGIAAEDINCRCVVLIEPRWDLEESFTKRDSETGELREFENIQDYQQFKEKYWEKTFVKEDKSGLNVYSDGSNVHYKKHIEPVSKNNFIPANSIEEAQGFAKRYCNDGFMAKTFKGKIDYKGISLDNANAINKALSETFETVDLEKISGIKAVSPMSAIGKKAFKDGTDAVMAYSPIEHGIFINKDILKNDSAFAEYLKKSQEAWDLVINNIDKLSGKSKETALIYKNAGRSLVDGTSVEGMLKHELGHHAQWTLLDSKTNNLVGSRMSRFSPKISGYANSSKSEYLAESFSAYLKGEYDILDPEYVKFINSKLLDKSDRNGIIKEAVDKGNIKLDINHEKQARHIKGEPEYKEGKSYLTISEKEAQNIINQKNRTGKLVFDKNGNWKNKELIDCDIEIGVDVDGNTGKESITNKGTIHYSKTGTHLVPRKEKEHD